MDIPFKAKEGKNGIAAIGSALVDLCLMESADFVNNSGAQMGGMVMVDYTHINKVLLKSGNEVSIVPGGSAGNTIVGIGKLGGKARFIGKRGDDDLGRIYEESLRDAGVDPMLLMSHMATGRVLSIITPDAQRSMLTYLGAASELKPEDVKAAACFDDCAIVHLEGYLLFNADLLMAALRAAKLAGALVSLDLASYNVVEASINTLNEIVDGGLVDILIANEDETASFTGIKGDESAAARALGKRAPLSVMKLGKRGSVVICGGDTLKIAPCGDGQSAVDTTGAGDLWASGFLYGLVNGYDLKRCGDLGSVCGYEVCQVVGAQIPPDGWERILSNYIV
ncbi:MAG: adenosine kinase [Chitinispirillia bacterium]|nr:adenosine kinase [Chitinispirillia bacterium]MCL2268889.1 adenosine kinase [Chitinispirillia bacterium]